MGHSLSLEADIGASLGAGTADPGYSESVVQDDVELTTQELAFTTAGMWKGERREYELDRGCV